MSKFRVGDKVKVTQVLYNGRVQPGSIGFIKEVSSYHNGYFCYQVKFENDPLLWSLLDQELELIPSLNFNAGVFPHQGATISTFNFVPYKPSRRDFFAAAAMQGKIASGTWYDSNELAEFAVLRADALIAELDKGTK